MVGNEEGRKIGNEEGRKDRVEGKMHRRVVERGREGRQEQGINRYS
jgi:hypothetical protein